MFEGAFHAAARNNDDNTNSNSDSDSNSNSSASLLAAEDSSHLEVLDLWKGQVVTSDAAGFSAEVLPHDTRIFRVVK
jgi:hypothetical protein